jgi:putative redox protein
MTEIIVRSGTGLRQTIEVREHTLVADEPVEAGGSNAGPTPYELLLGALGACTAITVRMYAARHEWPLESVSVHLAHERVHASDCENCDNPQALAFLDRITKRVDLQGALTDDQRARLLDIAERCPVARTLGTPPIVQTMPGAAIP